MTINTIISEIKDCGMYSIMCDEARPYKTEQLSICVRYIIPNSYSLCERFIGFYDVSNGRGAEHVFIEILSVLKKFGISDIPLVAQTYDGANVMSRSTSGVQTRIKDSHAEAIFIHCMAHKLNLVVTNTCRTIKESNTFFNTLKAVYVNFSQPDKDKLLQDLQKSMQIKSLSISRLCETHIDVRCKKEETDLTGSCVNENTATDLLMYTNRE
ncbi:PREDICTED: zinc finger MYM-type protein 1-like [Diuraphis noxia]|uniref:zinc finger MYM-type protein 1-like n=1 Tax=Diuraphis noxia TaxID=143948 RepID=UPI000763758B|nr:PREDICTED: zinc finger MYM-type protein 1-like [Diuraphis noxia]